jgi:hypothetical protein
VSVTDLDVLGGQVAVNDRVCFCTAHASAALENICECIAQKESENLAVDELNQSLAVATVTTVGELMAP